MAIKPLIYYDIASAPPLRTYSPNPSKARYALNIKRLPFATTWVPLPDIAKVRTAIGAAAVRKFADGSDFHTLPVLQDPNNADAVIGDSFDIAVYLDSRYPGSGEPLFLAPGDRDSSATATGLDYVSPHTALVALVPLSEITSQEHRHYARFNREVDATFTAYVLMFGHGIPFPPETADESKAEFVRRSGVGAWDDLAVHGERRAQMMLDFKQALASLAALFDKNEGPFLEGNKVTYADAIVGGWLRWITQTAREGEWEEVASWHGGVFGSLYDALGQYFDLK